MTTIFTTPTACTRTYRNGDAVEPLEAAALAGAGLAAGSMNAVVGSGTLITFPTLLALGYPPVLANVSNTVGLVPGVVGAVYGYRRELRGQRRRILRFGTASLLGGLAGALLLLRLPDETFQAVIPVLILTACALVLLQPLLSRRLARRDDDAHKDGGAPMWAGVFGTGVYGGYFGAAQGVILMGLFGAFVRDDLQRLNAVKNVLAALVNAVASIVFIVVTDVDWTAAGIIATGSTTGGFLGAHLGRKLTPALMRTVIVTIGTTAALTMILR